ncbi:MAG: oligosaccharide flippase family protein [Chloroflexi bacterium]|nr:oligosaccharide flippase family protein [Chloroflexota bacterium]
MTLARRSINSITWNSAANLVRVAVLLIRSILLARWLPVDLFGIYAFASSIVRISSIVANFGLGGAFLHRSPETENEDQAASAHFTLTALFSFIWAFLLIVGALLFADDSMLITLLVLIITAGGAQLIQTPRLILIRRVIHRRLVIVQTVNVIVISLVAVFLAWRGAGVWALLSTNIVGLVLGVFAWYVWKPVWRPRLSWKPAIVRYYLRFGSRNSLAAILSTMLDRVDDLWTYAFLGKIPLGFYSRAYTFATYPRIVLARPVNSVTVGTYAELKDDRKRLSQAFFRANALLVRSGFFLAGLIALVAPEFIRLVLGDKWIPMLDAFRLMLAFTLLDPIKMSVANLFVAMGKPERIVEARVAQLGVLLVGLFGLGLTMGITGVALAVDAMLFVGIVILLWRARLFVDFSPRRLFVAPGGALVLGLLLARGSLALPHVLGSDWRTGAVKTAVFIPTYALTLFLWEREQLIQMALFLARHIPGRAGQWLLSKGERWRGD